MFFQTKPKPKHRFVTHTIHVPKCIATILIALADRLFADDADGDAFQSAIRPFFNAERPRVAMLKGDDIWFNLEGPIHVCGDKKYPLGAQVHVDSLGWLNLGPVEATELHAHLREALDVAAYRWLMERDLLSHFDSCRVPRDRDFDDHVALRQMAAAASRTQPKSQSNAG